MSEDKKESELSAQELAALAENEANAATARLKAAREAADAAAEEQYQATAKDLKIEKAAESYTDKRSGDVIFRRELGEPEFWLDSKDRVPSRPVLTSDEENEISRKVEIPTDQTPAYNPEHILSKEFGGTSNYEIGLTRIKEEAEQRTAIEADRPGGGVDSLRRAGLVLGEQLQRGVLPGAGHLRHVVCRHGCAESR